MQADEETGHFGNEDDDDTTSFLRSKPFGQETETRASLRYSLIDVSDQLSYSWKDIEVYGVPPVKGNIITRCFQEQSTEKKQLLKKVTGIARSGELLAVMGSSGAGKTTLLNALAFRTPPGIKVSPGSIRALNGVQVDSETLRSRCGYIQQDDLFIGNLTTREHLVFQALLRMGKAVSRNNKMLKVDQVISDLSLSKCENTLIGVPGRDKGLSGGEKKRLAFATEALTDPNLLLCDEPTSGLDSYMAGSVIKVLKKLARKGKTIICTIHQPSSETFNLFDKLLLMSEGRVAFLGTIREANEFFTELGTPCPPNFNPADFFVQLLAIAPGREAECRVVVNKVSDAFALTEIADTIMEDATIKEHDIVCKVSQSNVRAGWWTQFYVILWRSWVSVLKEPVLVKVRLFQTIMIAVLLGVVFYGQILDQDGIMNINGAIFLFLTNMTFDNVFSVINVFCSELPIFLLEKRARLYGADVYFLGKTLSQLPLFLILPLIFTGICYPMIGLVWTIPHFAYACLIVTLIANVSTSFGYMISCSSSTISVAMSLAAPIIAPFLMFGGYYLNAASVPKYLVWLSYFSWFKYGNEALVVNQWQDITDIHCSNKSATTCYRNGTMVLKKLNFVEENFYWDIGALVGLFMLFRLIAYIALAIRSRGSG